MTTCRMVEIFVNYNPVRGLYPEYIRSFKNSIIKSK
jgi:hypothetical protein